MTDEVLKSSADCEILLKHDHDGTPRVEKTFKKSELLEKEIRISQRLQLALPFQQEGETLIYPYCRPLSELLTTPLADGAARELIIKLAELLKDLSTNDIVHRDLKPSNIYIYQDDELRLSDFETVQEEDGSKTCGTPGFMAPEQYTQTAVDWKADQYSIGVIAYKILTGSLPFNASSPEEYLRLQSQQAPDPSVDNPKLSKAVCDLTRRMLEPVPDQRFNTAGELLEALQGAWQAKVVQPILEEKTVVIKKRKKDSPSTFDLVLLIIFIILTIIGTVAKLALD